MDYSTAWWVTFSFCRFHLNGSSSAQCTEEGKWSVDLPVCTRESLGPQFWGERLVGLPGTLLVLTLYIPCPGNPSVLTLWDGCSPSWGVFILISSYLGGSTTLLEGQKESIQLMNTFVSSTWWNQWYLGLVIPSFSQFLTGYVWHWSIRDCHHWTRKTGNWDQTSSSYSGTSFIHLYIYTYIHTFIHSFIHLCILRT